MLPTVKKALRNTRAYHLVRNFRRQRAADAEVRDWIRAGKPVPTPHRVKEDTLRVYAERYGLRMLVETGTYLGDMVEALKDLFGLVYTIELSPVLSANARKRFRDYSHIRVIEGDSGKELQRLMPAIDEPCLFWLDGHYSAGVTARGDKDTPIYEELEGILGAPDLGHVVVIDDARCFGSDPAYPTLAEIARFIEARRSAVTILVENDSIRVLPKERQPKTDTLSLDEG